MTIEAQFEDGMLKPLDDLHLRPGERVSIVVLRRADPARWDLRRLASNPAEDIEFAEEGMDDWSDRLDAEDRQ